MITKIKRKNKGDFKKGQIPWNKGIKLPYYNKDKMGFKKGNDGWKKRKGNNTTKGEQCYNWKGGKPSCKECFKKLSSYKNKLNLCMECYGKTQFGENNPAWKGGLTPLNKKIRYSFRMRQWTSD